MADISISYAKLIHDKKLGHHVDIAPDDYFPNSESVRKVAREGKYLYASAKINGKVRAIFVEVRDKFEQRFGRFLRTFDPSALELSFRALSEHEHSVVMRTKEPKAAQHPRTATYQGGKRRRPVAWEEAGLRAHALRRSAV